MAGAGGIASIGEGGEDMFSFFPPLPFFLPDGSHTSLCSSLKMVLINARSVFLERSYSNVASYGLPDPVNHLMTVQTHARYRTGKQSHANQWERTKAENLGAAPLSSNPIPAASHIFTSFPIAALTPTFMPDKVLPFLVLDR